MSPTSHEHHRKEAAKKSPDALREENARMAHALEWILNQRHTPRAYRHMQFEKLVDAAKYGLGETDSL